MKTLKRRDALALIGGTTTAALLSGGCSPALRGAIARRQNKQNRREDAPVPALPQTGDILPIVRLLNRAAFAPARGDVARVTEMGKTTWVEAQLNAPASDESDDAGPFAPIGLRGIGGIHPSAYDLRDLGQNEVLQQLTQTALLRAVYSPWQLRERMVDFWSNHFNIYGRKNLSAFLLDGDLSGVLRANALGNFPDLLRASAHSPAMLGYLDNGQNQKGVANENYARELMELHTMGVGSGYTQRDVAEVARCLTGWTTEERFLHKKGTFRFDLSRHDSGEKTVLGVKIEAGGGQSDGDTVLDLLAHHLQTAHFIAEKLVRYFISTEDAHLTARIASIYLKTGGDIKSLLRPILLSDEITNAPPIMKRPFDYLVSSLRVTQAQTDGARPVQSHLRKMGQALWEWPMPDGYPDTTGAWTGSLLHRWNFAGALAQNKIRGTSANWHVVAKTPEETVQNLLAARAGDIAHAPLLSVLKKHAAPHEWAALVLAAPAFQWR